jgi:hypothetical protein
MITFTHDESSSFHYHMTMSLLCFHYTGSAYVSKTCFSMKPSVIFYTYLEDHYDVAKRKTNYCSKNQLLE